ncbi:MAG: hypothetical protein K6C13_07625 [Oscillospiraceae bacterium]|nr:hypothetical protein [Oscillospiraceae bacterium]
MESLVPGEREGLYYLTYYLVQPELAGKTIHARIENAYTPTQTEAVFEAIQSAQTQWREDYSADSMTADEWKAIWKTEDLDGRTLELTRTLLDESDKVITGTWTADISLTDTKEPLLFIDKGGCLITADSLSVHISHEEQYDKQPVFIFTLRDCMTLITSAGTDMTDWLIGHGAISESYREFAYMRGTDNGRVYSYGSLCPPDRIEKIEMYLFEYDTDGTTADSPFLNVTNEVIYEDRD